ncbi:MAG: SAM-dependent methyltransferase [Blastocatellia bacterium]|nr:MAG: SAM-dependent methyltransferase [Blastocatellia bacterium]
MPITYDQIAPSYDRKIRPLERWFLDRLRREAFALLPATGRILELGAGTGLNFIHYRSDAHGVATEPNKAMIDIARVKERPGGVTLVQNCAEELPFARASFDAAIVTLVFCSVRSPAEAFEELRRVIRRGGTVVLLEHVRPDGVLGPVFDLLSAFTVPLSNDHFNRRTADAARTAGLQVIDVRKFGLGIINLISCRV